MIYVTYRCLGSIICQGLIENVRRSYVPELLETALDHTIFRFSVYARVTVTHREAKRECFFE